jgi:hypothetical protein
MQAHTSAQDEWKHTHACTQFKTKPLQASLVWMCTVRMSRLGPWGNSSWGYFRPLGHRAQGGGGISGTQECVLAMDCGNYSLLTLGMRGVDLLCNKPQYEVPPPSRLQMPEQWLQAGLWRAVKLTSPPPTDWVSQVHHSDNWRTQWHFLCWT